MNELSQAALPEWLVPSWIGRLRRNLRRWLEQVKPPSISYRGETIALYRIPLVR